MMSKEMENEEILFFLELSTLMQYRQEALGKWQECKGFIGVRLILAPKGTRLFSRGKLRRSFMGNTREQEFLQAQQPVPNAAVEPEY